MKMIEDLGAAARPPPRLRGAIGELLTTAAQQVMVEGPAGTGKTQGILWHLDHLCRTFPGCRVLLARQTRFSLSESVLQTLEDEVFGPSHPCIRGSRATRHNRMSYRYPNASVMVPRGMDRPEGMYSTQWDVVYVAEAIEVTRDAWEKFGRAMRHRAIPRGRFGWLRPGEKQLADEFGNLRYWRQRICDTNPGNPGHWLNDTATPADDSLRSGSIHTREDYQRLQAFNRRALVPKTLHRLISCHKDNPAYWDLKRWGWTADGADYVGEELDGLTGHRRYRLHDGLWVAAEGTVYPEFSLRHHVIDAQVLPADWPMFVGYDPGFDHPTAILWFAVAPDGSIIICDEIYAGGRYVKGHCDEIKRRNSQGPGRMVLGYYGDPQEFFHKKAQGRSCARQALRCGFRFKKWPPTGVHEQAMVDAVRELLINTANGVPGAQKLYVMRHCVNTIREFQSWSYKRTRSGEVPDGSDHFVDADNHAMDVVKGMVATGRLSESATRRAA